MTSKSCRRSKHQAGNSGAIFAKQAIMIYLDHNATTPLAPGVLSKMLPFLGQDFGNPSSRHPLGYQARRAVESARATLATFLHCQEHELVFTSGGTESVALAFHCALASGPRTIVISAVEHACVLDAAEAWRRHGCPLETCPVDENGQVELESLERILFANPGAFVSVIWVNNETGVISPVELIADLCKKHGALLHLDGVQAMLRTDVDLDLVPCDYLSLSAHKFGGPKGAGALVVRGKAPRAALMPGQQEQGLRGGTENVPAVVGMAAALRLQPLWREEMDRQAGMCRFLEQSTKDRLPGVSINGGCAPRIGNTTNLYFPGKNAADLVSALGQLGLCVSAGAACSLGGRPSHVLQAMGLGEARANSSLRFSLGPETSDVVIRQTVDLICQAAMSTLSTWGHE